MAKISLIAAVDRRGGIGYQNRLLYWLPNDLKRFKALTTGHTIVMGRRTFESLPKGALPNRRNIVLSRQPDAEFPGAEHFTSLQQALAYCAQDEEVFIIGGASLYADAIAVADALYLTLVDDDSQPADAFFPALNPEDWNEKGRDARPVDEKHLYPYAFVDYERVR